MGPSSDEYSPERMREALKHLAPFLIPAPDLNSVECWQDVEVKAYHLDCVSEAEKMLPKANQNCWEFRILLCEAATNLSIRDSGIKSSNYRRLYKNIATLVSSKWLKESLEVGNFVYAELSLKFMLASDCSESALKLDALKKEKRGMPWENLVEDALVVGAKQHQNQLCDMCRMLMQRFEYARVVKKEAVYADSSYSKTIIVSRRVSKKEVIDLVESDDGNANAISAEKSPPKDQRPNGIDARAKPAQEPTARMPAINTSLRNKKSTPDGFYGFKMPATNMSLSSNESDVAQIRNDFGAGADLLKIIKRPGFMHMFENVDRSKKQWNSLNCSAQYQQSRSGGINGSKRFHHTDNHGGDSWKRQRSHYGGGGGGSSYY